MIVSEGTYDPQSLRFAVGKKEARAQVRKAKAAGVALFLFQAG